MVYKAIGVKLYDNFSPPINNYTKTFITYMFGSHSFPKKLFPNEDLEALTKDCCVFCDERLATRTTSRSGKRWRGSHYYEYEENYTTLTHLVTDLDVVHFTYKVASVDKEIREEWKKVADEVLQSKCDDLVQRVTDSTDTLPDDEQDIALSTIHRNFREGLKNKLSHGLHHFTYTELQQVFKAYHNDENFYPKGILSHASCWPLDVGEFSMSLKDFKVALSGPRTTNYFQAVYNHYKEYPEALQLAEGLGELEAIIKARKYHPLEWV